MQQQQALIALGSAIRTARISRQLTQVQLADLCGCDPTYISMIESGKRNPPFLTIYRIAEKLQQSLAGLMRSIN